MSLAKEVCEALNPVWHTRLYGGTAACGLTLSKEYWAARLIKAGWPDCPDCLSEIDDDDYDE